MTNCDCDACIGRGKEGDKNICPYVKENIKGGIVGGMNWNGDNGPEAIIPIPKGKRLVKEEVIPMLFRKDDGSKFSKEEVMALYDRVNEEYGKEK